MSTLLFLFTHQKRNEEKENEKKWKLWLFSDLLDYVYN